MPDASQWGKMDPEVWHACHALQQKLAQPLSRRERDRGVRQFYVMETTELMRTVRDYFALMGIRIIGWNCFSQNLKRTDGYGVEWPVPDPDGGSEVDLDTTEQEYIEHIRVMPA